MTSVDSRQKRGINLAFRPPRVCDLGRLAAVAACLLLVSCGGGGGGGGGPPAPVIVSIGATPTALVLGQSTTLNWSSSNASECEASGAWGGNVGPSGTQVVTPPFPGTFTYRLNCDGTLGSASVVVAAAAPVPTVNLSLTPASLAAGQQSLLTWSTTNATSCTASGAWAGAQSSSGSIQVSQASAGTYFYSLACTGAGGTASGAVTLAIIGQADNVASVVVDNGPAGANFSIKVPFVSVPMICGLLT